MNFCPQESAFLLHLLYKSTPDYLWECFKSQLFGRVRTVENLLETSAHLLYPLYKTIVQWTTAQLTFENDYNEIFGTSGRRSWHHIPHEFFSGKPADCYISYINPSLWLSFEKYVPQRKWKQLLASKPDEKYEDPKDVAAMEFLESPLTAIFPI